VGGIEVLLGAAGDSNDNALAETIIGLYKAELIEAHSPWRTPGAVECATLRMEWFKPRRLLGSIGHSLPEKHERAYHAATLSEAKAA
jgi:transposase InsO family protein